MIEDPRTFTLSQLRTRLAALQKDAFAIYETAAARAEAEPVHRETYYALAERDVAPLLAKSRRLNDELVRRMRRRARRWKQAAAAVAVLGGAVIAALWLRMHGRL